MYSSIFAVIRCDLFMKVEDCWRAFLDYGRVPGMLLQYRYRSIITMHLLAFVIPIHSKTNGIL